MNPDYWVPQLAKELVGIVAVSPASSHLHMSGIMHKDVENDRE